MRVMSFNLRYDTPKDGPNAWPKREAAVRWVWEHVDADVVGVQEALPHQLDDLMRWVSGYEYVGRGRDADGGGEHVAIFFKRDVWECLEHGDFWLSDTPDVPGSRTFGNRLPRMVTWARLRNRTGQTCLFVNTHLDHESEEAKVKGAWLITSFIAEGNADEPVVLTGDFNAGPDSSVLRTFLQAGTLVDLLAQLGADQYTVHGFKDVPNARIDYILGSPDVLGKKAVVLTEKPQGLYPSDHYPIYADVEIDKGGAAAPGSVNSRAAGDM